MISDDREDQRKYQNRVMINKMKMDILFVLLNYLIDLNIVNDNIVVIIDYY